MPCKSCLEKINSGVERMAENCVALFPKKLKDQWASSTNNECEPWLLALHFEVSAAKDSELAPFQCDNLARLFQLRVFRSGFAKRRDVRVGIFPQGEEILVGSASLGRVAGQRVGASRGRDAPGALWHNSTPTRDDRGISGILLRRRCPGARR